MDSSSVFMILYDGTWYTIEEFGKVLEPIYQRYEAIIEKCITGLTQYGACLAAAHQDALIPELRRFIITMASFWDLNHDLSKDGDLRLIEKYGGAFDRAVAEARVSNQAPDLSAEARADILSGLAC